MMGAVIDLAKHKEENSPHLRGRVRCIGCKHEWEAVAPVGTTLLECPECDAHKGLWMGVIMPPERQIWTCNCGGELFYITPDGTFCPNCGVYQNF
jgi:hypothetical protein